MTGFGIKGGDSSVYCLVRAGVVDTSRALADVVGGTVIEDVYGKDLGESWSYLVFQMVGQDWTIYVPTYKNNDATMERLSERVASLCMAWSTDDTSGWTCLDTYSSGEHVERYAFGDGDEGYLEHAEFVTDRGRPWDWISMEGGRLYQYRSSIRPVDQAMSRLGNGLVDVLMTERGAWLPPAACHPWLNADCKPDEGTVDRDGFVRVDLVTDLSYPFFPETS